MQCSLVLAQCGCLLVASLETRELRNLSSSHNRSTSLTTQRLLSYRAKAKPRRCRIEKRMGGGKSLEQLYSERTGTTGTATCFSPVRCKKILTMMRVIYSRVSHESLSNATIVSSSLRCRPAFAKTLGASATAPQNFCPTKML